MTKHITLICIIFLITITLCYAQNPKQNKTETKIKNNQKMTNNAVQNNKKMCVSPDVAANTLTAALQFLTSLAETAQGIIDVAGSFGRKKRSVMSKILIPNN